MNSKVFRGWMVWIALAMILTMSPALAQSADEVTSPAPEDWPTYGRTLDAQRFSPLDQITAQNVDGLRLAWVRSLPWQGVVQVTPIVYDGTMYLNMPSGVIAMDAVTGETLWQYAPEFREGTGGVFGYLMRGAAVVFEGNVFLARADGVVVALDAATGEELWATPVTEIQLSEGFTSGPIFADGKILVGPSGGDFGGLPGKIHALDAENGELLWSFNIIPGPDDPAYETWEPKPTGDPGYGGGAAWTPGAYDPITRTVVWGTGQPTPWDRYNIRRGSADLYTNSYVALDIDTGELKWYHQVVPADEWDADQHVTPVITDLEVDGEPRRVAMLATTTGYIVLIDMMTGEFIDAHAMMPEHTIHLGYEEDGTPIINEDARFEEPGETTMVCPFRWASYELGSYSPQTGLYYRPNSWECWDLAVFPLEDDWQPGQAAYNYENTSVLDRFDRVGALSAIDPVSGEVVWEFSHGYIQRAGALATAGGVVFGAFPDRTFRAFDAATGDVLWEQLVTSTTSGNPITYAVDGVQYVAIPVGGSGGGARADVTPVVSGPPTMFVFSLPDDER